MERDIVFEEQMKKERERETQTKGKSQYNR